MKRDCNDLWAFSFVGDLRQHREVGADFVLHPLIHTSATSESSTKCGSGFFRGRVWIKVCNLHFLKQKGRATSDPASY